MNPYLAGTYVLGAMGAGDPIAAMAAAAADAAVKQAAIDAAKKQAAAQATLTSVPAASPVVDAMPAQMSTAYSSSPSRVTLSQPPPWMAKSTKSRDDKMVAAAATIIPSIVGSAAGAVFWKNHRWLGFFGGGAVGASIYPIASGRILDGADTLVPMVAGVGASLAWKKHPAWGFILGSLGTGLAMLGVDLAVRKK